MTYFSPTLQISRKPTSDLLLSDFDFSAVLGLLEGNPPHKERPPTTPEVVLVGDGESDSDLQMMTPKGAGSGEGRVTGFSPDLKETKVAHQEQQEEGKD